MGLIMIPVEVICFPFDGPSSLHDAVEYTEVVKRDR